jgi:hypothetical protein
MSFFTKEVTHKKFTVRFKIVLLILVVLLFWIFHSFILEGTGNFLVAQAYPAKNADVILLEEEYNNKQAINMCNNLYKETGAKEVWIVVLPDSTQLFTEKQLEKTFKESMDTLSYNFAFKFFTYSTEHPYTLHKSAAVLDSLKAKGFKKVVLLTEGFHSKRSFKVYKKLFAPQGIDVYCTTYFTESTPENWWKDSNGFRRVVSEYLKYIYYLVKGYI